MRNEVMMTRRAVMVGLAGLTGSLIVGPLLPSVSLADHSAKVKEMLEKGDHAGLAEYYKKQADEARHNAEGEKAMASEYLKKYPKGQFSKHCEKMADKFLAEAKENDALADLHSKAAKGGK
jgi:DNA repair photolyase